MQDDVQQKFSPLHRAGGKSLVSQMLEVQGCQIRQPSFDYWPDFTCLSIENKESTSARSRGPKKVLYRSKPAIAAGNFVAISYRWRHSCRNGGYHIAAGQGLKQMLSKAPDSIMDRVVHYVTHFDLSAFWIDQECIDQQDSNAKEFAIQSMDLVYRCSRRPLGILTTPLLRRGQLKLLHQIMLKEIVVMNDSRPQLAHWVKFWKARKLLKLLVYIMGDPWWRRRWIFQEEYCSSGKMQLLIPNKTGLLPDKFHATLGDVPGEVLIKAAEFREAVTLFCLACSASVFRAGTDRKRCMYVLRQAQTYKLLQRYGLMVDDDSVGRAMSTRILGDICRRAGEKPEDALAITANCCGYPVRLDSQKLKITSTSLSVAMITLFLLNGELFWNDQRSITAVNGFTFLKELSFNNFDPPVNEKKLTFMKKCRLVNVRLTKDGMKTTGHLWCVDQEIQTKTLRRTRFRHTNTDTEACLHRLAAKLEKSYPKLAYNLYQCQNEEVPEHLNKHGLREIYKRVVSFLKKAISRGQKLIVAHLVGSSQHWAIFVSQKRLKSQPIFIFTAYESAEYSELVKKYRSAVKYVSLSVSTSAVTARGLPRLQTRGWVNGLTFPENVSPKDVIFSWPAAMERFSTS